MSSFMLPEKHPLFGLNDEQIKILYRQRLDYDCGPTAVAFMLGEDPDFVRKHLPHSPEKGTNPDDVILFLMEQGKRPYRACRGIMPKAPLLVNYQHKFPDGTVEGHYGVIVASSMDYCYTIFDPWLGEFFTIGDAQFAVSWYSKNYYEMWGCWVEPALDLSPWFVPELNK